MNTFTSNITKNAAKILATAFLLGTASFAQAGTTVVTVTDNYLYESLIQTEFDIENQMQASVEQSSSETFQQVLMAAIKIDAEQVESAQVKKVLAE